MIWNVYDILNWPKYNVSIVGCYQANEEEVFFMGGGNEPSRGKKSEEAVT